MLVDFLWADTGPRSLSPTDSGTHSSVSKRRKGSGCSHPGCLKMVHVSGQRAMPDAHGGLGRSVLCVVQQRVPPAQGPTGVRYPPQLHWAPACRPSPGQQRKLTLHTYYVPGFVSDTGGPGETPVLPSRLSRNQMAGIPHCLLTCCALRGA